MRITQRGILAIVIIFALITGITMGATTWFLQEVFSDQAEVSMPSFQEDQGATTSLSYKEIVARVSPTIVAITTTMEIDSIFFESYSAASSGSGVIYDQDEDGIFVITNHHVVDGAGSIIVELSSGQMLQGEVLGSDADTDLAVVYIELSKTLLRELPMAKLGDASKVLPGEFVLAIGNSLGYGQSVTAGIISATNRNLGIAGNYSYTLLQTDAAINPGNSGGALVNERGDVIGINTVKIADTSVEGVGFAIPINDVMPIIEVLRSQGYLPKPYLGITGRDASLSYQDYDGALVISVQPNTAAAEAGLEAGDIITKIDDTSISSMEDLVGLIRSYQPGDQIRLTYVREGNLLTVTLTLGERE